MTAELPSKGVIRARVIAAVPLAMLDQSRDLLERMFGVRAVGQLPHAKQLEACEALEREFGRLPGERGHV